MESLELSYDVVVQIFNFFYVNVMICFPGSAAPKDTIL